MAPVTPTHTSLQWPRSRSLRIIVFAAAVTLAASCASNDGVATTTDMPTTAAAPSTAPGPPSLTTTLATTTAGPTTVTTPIATPLDPNSVPPLLVADLNGIRVVDDGAVVASFLEGRAATIAVPDLRGGVVFQGNRSESTGLEWDEGLGRHVLQWGNGGPDPILAITGPGAAPVELIAHPDALLTLIDVVAIDGRPNALYVQYMGGPGGRESGEAWSQVLEYLCLYDLTDGDTEVLGLLGSYESSFTRMRIGGDLVAVTFDAYGESTGTHVGVLAFTSLFADVEYDWLPTLAMDSLHYGPGPAGRCDIDECVAWALATMAADGSRLSWVEGGLEWDASGGATVWPLNVVTIDPATGDDRLRRRRCAAPCRFHGLFPIERFLHLPSPLSVC